MKGIINFSYLFKATTLRNTFHKFCWNSFLKTHRVSKDPCAGRHSVFSGAVPALTTVAQCGIMSGKHCMIIHRDYKIGLPRSSSNRQTLNWDNLQTRRNILMRYEVQGSP